MCVGDGEVGDLNAWRGCQLKARWRGRECEEWVIVARDRGHINAQLVADGLKELLGLSNHMLKEVHALWNSPVVGGGYLKLFRDPLD
jgi:hypothetical protein